MQRWFTRPSTDAQNPGDFLRWTLRLDQASDPDEFLAELGRRVIEMYIEPLEYLRGTEPELEDLSIDMTSLVERLFGPNGDVSDLFTTFAGEVLCTWADHSFAGHELALPPSPHENIPAFDSINIGEDEEGVYICLIQAKTTRTDVSGEANLAARQLGRLEQGHFLQELSAALEEIARRTTDRDRRNALFRALIDSSRRKYLVGVVHQVAAPGSVLGNYDRHIPGPTDKRRCGFIRFPSWRPNWQQAGDSAHAEALRRLS